METDKRFNLVKRNAVEIVTEEELKKVLQKEKITAYYGIAPTGPVHIGYFATLSKIFDLTNAGIKTKILIADIHAALDDLKTPWSEIDKRAQYYKKCIELSFPWKEKPEFILGSDFQLDPEYQMDVLKIASMATINRTKRAASEVTRMKEPKVSEMIYPIMQTLDEQYLNVDIQLGGLDQRHIMAFARDYLPKIDYKSRVEIMMPLMVSLKGPGVKMSASIPESHIKVYESEQSIKDKINKAYCPAKDVKENPILQICRFIIFPVKGILKVERHAKYGGDVSYASYPELEEAYASGKLFPLDLKNAVARDVAENFKKAREYFSAHKEELEVLGERFRA